MEKLHAKHYPGTPFSVEVSTVTNQSDFWDSTRISIFRNKVHIGEYLRNYPSYGALTFYPFKIGTDWYALYSAHYRSVRVMKLYEDRIEDWCGQVPTFSEFCPVEIYVPRYRSVKSSVESANQSYEFETYAVDCDYATEEKFLEDMPEFDSEQYTDFGFLCGCILEDDSAWRIQYIDLSQITAKILNVTNKFGYWEMPQSTTLRQCIDMTKWEPDHHWVSLTRAEHINLKTDERC
jgi:hypothetical protein